jgi:predicted nucleic acid-binding protein
MPSCVVADASCLIDLARIDRLNVLRDLFAEITIPAAVYREVVEQGHGRPGSAAVKATPWIRRQEVQDQLAVRALRVNQLGQGECDAMILALEQDADFLILDYARARKAALALALPVIGTVAVLHKAAEKGLIQDLDVVEEQLAQVGFRFVESGA